MHGAPQSLDELPQLATIWYGKQWVQLGGASTVEGKEVGNEGEGAELVLAQVSER